MMRLYQYFVVSLVLLLSSPAHLLALDPTDLPSASTAGVTEARIRETAGQQLLRKEPAKEVEVEVEKPPEMKKEDVTLVVKRIRLQGDAVVPFEEFESLLSRYRRDKMTFDDLSRLCRLLETEYRFRGYFAAVFLPPQKIKEGDIFLEVVLSKMGKLIVEGARYFRQSKIRSYWSMKPGEILRYDEIRKSIEKINQNPDRTARPILKAGEETATTDVYLKVTDQFPLHVGYSFDNKGVKLTGKRRTGFTVRSNNMLSLDDIFVVGTSYGKDFGALYLQHQIPITGFGTSFTWGFSHAQVNPKEEFERFGINGLSQTYSMSLRQSLTSSPKFTSEIYAGFDFKEKRTRTLSVVTAWNRLRVLSLGGKVFSRTKTGVWSLGQDFFFGFSPHGDGFPLTSQRGESRFFK